jgi:WD40 repeat protein
MKTGRLLDILAGHEGPVSGLAFSPRQPLLASSSWDRTVRTWDVFDGKVCICGGGLVLLLLSARMVLAPASALDCLMWTSGSGAAWTACLLCCATCLSCCYSV